MFPNLEAPDPSKKTQESPNASVAQTNGVKVKYWTVLPLKITGMKQSEEINHCLNVMKSHRQTPLKQVTAACKRFSRQTLN